MPSDRKLLFSIGETVEFDQDDLHGVGVIMAYAKDLHDFYDYYVEVLEIIDNPKGRSLHTCCDFFDWDVGWRVNDSSIIGLANGNDTCEMPVSFDDLNEVLGGEWNA